MTANAIFCETTVRVSKTFITNLAPSCGKIEDFFTSIEQDTGVSSYEDHERVRFIKGDWPAVNRAYQLLALHNGETSDKPDDDKWSSLNHQQSDFLHKNNDSNERKKTQFAKPEDFKDNGATYSKTNKAENFCANEEIIDQLRSTKHNPRKKKPNVSREKKLQTAKSNASDLRHEPTIDKPLFPVDEIKPLFSVDEIIKNIVGYSYRTVAEHDYANPSTVKAFCDKKEIDELDAELSEEEVALNDDVNENECKRIKSRRGRPPKARSIPNNSKRTSKPNKRKSKPKRVVLNIIPDASSTKESFLKDEKYDPDYEDNNDPSTGMIIPSFSQKKLAVRGKHNVRRIPQLRSHQCTKCRKLFSSVSNLYRHMKIAHQGLRYQCPDCDKRFTCKESLQRHRRIVHQELRCKNCYVIFNDSEIHDNHVCPGSKVVDSATCPECGKTYSCASNLNKHIKVAHRGLSFSCELCEKNYKSKESLNEHQRSLHRVFKCLAQGCEEVYDNEEAYAEHIVGEHDGGHDAEDKIKKAKEKVVTKVIRRRLPANCEICGKTFSSVSNLGKHMKVVHEKVRHHCDKCPRSFTCKEQLSRHYRVVHEGVTFSCCFCTEQFVNRHSLAKHQQIVHKQLVMDSSFQCEICGKAFLYDCNLTRHKRRDHEGLRFECSICNKEFKSKQRVQEHDRVEHQGHRYMCEQCPKMFRNKHKLKEHVISSHTTLKPHNCQRCDLTFARRSALSYHILKVHDRLPNDPLPPEPIKKQLSENKSTPPTLPHGTETIFALENYDQTVQQSQGQVFMQHIPQEFSATDKQPVAITLGQESIVVRTLQPHQLHKTQNTSAPNPVQIQLEIQAQQTLASMTSFNQTQQPNVISLQSQLQPQHRQEQQQQQPEQQPPIQTEQQQQQQQQQQSQQEQSAGMLLPPTILQQMQPASNVGMLDATFAVQPTQLPRVEHPQVVQTLPFISQSTLPPPSLSNVEINHAISQALAQFPQASYIYPDGNNFFNTAPQQTIPVHLQLHQSQSDITSKNQSKDIN